MDAVHQRAVKGGKDSSPKTKQTTSVAGDGQEPADKQPKVEVLRRKRTLLDDILTVIFLGLVVLVFYHVRHDTYWLGFLVGALASVSVVIFLSKKVWRVIGRFLSEKVLNSQWTLVTDRRPLRKKQSMKKFTDQAWQVSE